MAESSSGIPREHRTTILRVPATLREAEEFKARAQRVGLTLAEYMRRTAVGAKIKSQVDQEAVLTLARINADQGRLGGLLKLWLTDDSKVVQAGGVEGKAGMKIEIRKLLNEIETVQQQLLQALEEMQ